MASSADITAALHLSVTPNCFIKIVLADSAAQVKVGGWGGAGHACLTRLEILDLVNLAFKKTMVVVDNLSF